MPEMRMNSLKSRAMNCGPLSEIMRTNTFSISRVENPPHSGWGSRRFDSVAKEAEFPDHSTSTLLF